MKRHMRSIVLLLSLFGSSLVFANNSVVPLEVRRYFCIGKVGNRVVTVRFTYRKSMVRIFGAGQWRKGKALYEKENSD